MLRPQRSRRHLRQSATGPNHLRPVNPKHRRGQIRQHLPRGLLDFRRVCHRRLGMLQAIRKVLSRY
jgi:hypothetical protein